MCHQTLQQRTLLKREVDLLCLIGRKLAVSGAETRLVNSMFERICSRLRLDPPEIILTRSLIWLEIRNGNFKASAQHKIQNFGINMSNVSELSLLCNEFLSGRMPGLKELRSKVDPVSSFKYNTTALCFIEAVAGLCFAYLNGGDLKVCLAALLGGLVLMLVGFCPIKQGFLTAFAFIAVAFAMLFSVPVRYLKYVALGGLMSMVLRTLLFNGLGIEIVIATFIACSVTSLYFIYQAPKLGEPRPVFTVASIIPLIPGMDA